MPDGSYPVNGKYPPDLPSWTTAEIEALSVEGLDELFHSVYAANLKKYVDRGYTVDPTITLADNCTAGEHYLKQAQEAKQKQAQLAHHQEKAIKVEAKKTTTEASTNRLYSGLRSAKTIAATGGKPIEWLVDGLLRRGTTNVIYAPSGHGKSYFAMGLCFAAATGGEFLRWQVPKPLTVLYFDGEMGSEELDSRIARLSPDPPESLIFFDRGAVTENDDNQADGGQADCGEADIWLDTERGRENVRKLIAKVQPDIIVFDNLLCLTSEIDTNSQVDYAPVKNFFIEISRKNKGQGPCVIIIDHANKTGGQLGTMTKASDASVVIKLEKPSEVDSAVSVTFPKWRGAKKPPPFRYELVDHGDVVEFRRQGKSPSAGKPDRMTQVLQAIAAGKSTQAKIIESLGITSNNLSALIKAATEKGWVTVGPLAKLPGGDKGRCLTLTAAGKHLVQVVSEVETSL